MQTTITIRVTTRASKNRIGELRRLPNDESFLAVYVTSVAENGKANDTVLRLLAEYFDVPVSCLAILKGQTSRLKVISIKTL